jgi:ubiquinone/menaquinone biosynthesis C-methylase UbiE
MDILQEKSFLAQQYRDAANLNARITLHARYSENPISWFQWVFDQFALPAQATILELGCGSGDLWQSNQERIPPGWQITLSDFSLGMATEARQKVSQIRQVRQVLALDAQAVPFLGRCFSAVLANHMLYHVADLPLALGEIRCVLQPNGRFYASTIGGRHLTEIHELTGQFDPELARQYDWGLKSFTLENGMRKLTPWFSSVQLLRYPTRLRVTEAEPLADYILSNTHYGIARQRRTELIDFIQARLETTGEIEISIDTGLFIAGRS